MKYEGLFDFILSCVVDVDQNGYAKFEALEGKKDSVKNFIEANHLENMKMSEFTELAKKHCAPIQYKDKIREKKIKIFMSKSPEDIAQLPLEEKVEILKTLFGYGLTDNELEDVCSKNKDKLTSLLYSIKLPKEFWKKEEKQADRFVALVANNKKITDNMKNWDNLNIEEKKATIQETAKIIEYIYNKPLEIDFYTSEEFRKSRNLDENCPAHCAYQSCGKIFFNVDYLENSDNYTGVSVVFHEFTHKRQFEEKFDNPLINRLFYCNTFSAVRYEDREVALNSNEYGDLYSLMPSEVHAYTMQKYVENNIADKTGIEKTTAKETRDKKQAHNKSFAMANITKARQI